MQGYEIMTYVLGSYLVSSPCSNFQITKTILDSNFLRCTYNLVGRYEKYRPSTCDLVIAARQDKKKKMWRRI